MNKYEIEKNAGLNMEFVEYQILLELYRVENRKSFV